MEAAVWAAIGILAAVQFGGFYLGFRIDSLGFRIDSLGFRIDALASRMDARFDRLDERFDRLDERLTGHIEHHPS
jgi:flagellar capping protein FliD